MVWTIVAETHGHTDEDPIGPNLCASMSRDATRDTRAAATLAEIVRTAPAGNLNDRVLSMRPAWCAAADAAP